MEIIHKLQLSNINKVNRIILIHQVFYKEKNLFVHILYAVCDSSILCLTFRSLLWLILDHIILILDQ